MFHKILIIVVIAFAMGVVGCRSCLSPYDLCQPTFVPAQGDRCMGELYRSGSVLGGDKHARDTSGDCQSCSGEIEPDSSYYMNANESYSNEASLPSESAVMNQSINDFDSQSEPFQEMPTYDSQNNSAFYENQNVQNYMNAPQNTYYSNDFMIQNQ